MSNNKMVYCKACGAQIASNAKTCPQCGAKNKKNRVLLIIILVVVGLFVLIGAIGGGNNEPVKTGEYEPTTTHSPASNPEPLTEAVKKEEQTSFSVGEIVSLNNIEVTLVGVTENNGSEFNKPADGNVYVLCEFEVVNNSSTEITVSSLMSFEAYCDDYATNMSIAAEIEKGNKNQLDSTVAAGKKINGVIGYEIPTDWEKLEIHFTPDFWSDKDITFVAVH